MFTNIAIMFESLLKSHRAERATIEHYLNWIKNTQTEKDAPNTSYFLSQLVKYQDPTITDFRFWFDRYLESIWCITADVNRFEALEDYEKRLCEKIVLGSIHPQESTEILSWLFGIVEYQDFRFWDWLNEEIWWVKDGNKTPYFLDDETEINHFILKCAEQSLIFHGLVLDRAFFSDYICETCLRVGEDTTMEVPAEHPLRLRRRRHIRNFFMNVCYYCKSEKVRSLNRFNGRELYLRTATSTPAKIVTD